MSSGSIDELSKSKFPHDCGILVHERFEMVAKPVTSILKIFLVVVETMGIGFQASAQVFEVSSPNP